MTKLLSLAAGGVAGTFARYFLGGFLQKTFGAAFPYGTLVVNLFGCFLIGFLAALAEEKLLLDENTKALLMTGFCGAFTTFSAFMLETGNMVQGGEMLKAWGYILISMIAGFFLFQSGVLLGRWAH